MGGQVNVERRINTLNIDLYHFPDKMFQKLRVLFEKLGFLTDILFINFVYLYLVYAICDLLLNKNKAFQKTAFLKKYKSHQKS